MTRSPENRSPAPFVRRKSSSTPSPGMVRIRANPNAISRNLTYRPRNTTFFQMPHSATLISPLNFFVVFGAKYR